MFKGQDLIDNKLNLPLKRDEYMPVFNDLVEDVYGSDDKRAILNSVMAHYAVTGDQELFDDSDVEAAIEAITGGISEINGYKLELPRGVREDDFEDFIDNFSSNDVVSMGGVSGYTPIQAQKAIQDGQIKSVGANQYHVLVDGLKLMNAKGSPLTLIYTKEVEAKKKAWDSALHSKEFAEGRSPTAALSGFAKRGGF